MGAAAVETSGLAKSYGGLGGQWPKRALDGDETILGSAPTPYHWTWDTTTEAEGTYQVSARATVSGQTVISAPITVVVDRTAPTVVSQTPAPGASNVAIGDAVSITFSEPLAPASVHPTTAFNVTGRGAAIAATSTLASDGKTDLRGALDSARAPSCRVHRGQFELGHHVPSAALRIDCAATPTVAWAERDATTGAVSISVWKSNY